jgi:hypothetical protein
VTTTTITTTPDFDTTFSFNNPTTRPVLIALIVLSNLVVLGAVVGYCIYKRHRKQKKMKTNVSSLPTTFPS